MKIVYALRMIVVKECHSEAKGRRISRECENPTPLSLRGMSKANDEAISTEGRYLKKIFNFP